uniref:Uncharacterized protein n=1 Tax=Coprothermobacter proteolyticus (strain ATCC 35245 / DSM 5265 / OCM 4 / BT) TaxID=309798 RepID=B5Y6A6_COPPD
MDSKKEGAEMLPLLCMQLLKLCLLQHELFRYLP